MPPVEDVKGKEEEDALADIDVVVDEPKEEEPEPKAKPVEKEERKGKAEEKDETTEKDELAGAKDDAEREKIRERRREERKLRKERSDAEARELRVLRDEVRELRERQGEQERTAKTGQYERIEAGINEAAGNMQRAKGAMVKAATDGDWNAHAEALEAYNQWRSRGEYLVTVKNDIVTQEKQPKAPKVDPEVARHAKEWMGRNAWYDPQAGDDDSKIAFRIDAALATQGFDPRTKEYWQEFDRRLAKQLPHRVKLESQADEADEDRDESPSKTTGSGRERAAGQKTVFKLSAARVAALREAGVDLQDKKALAPYIKRFMDYDKEHANDSKGDRK